jgi:hypothetical protein
MGGAAVPEAAIDEHGYFHCPEHDVGTATPFQQWPGIDSEAQAEPMEGTPERDLAGRVAASLRLHPAAHGWGRGWRRARQRTASALRAAPGGGGGHRSSGRHAVPHEFLSDVVGAKTLDLMHGYPTGSLELPHLLSAGAVPSMLLPRIVDRSSEVEWEWHGSRLLARVTVRQGN